MAFLCDWFAHEALAGRVTRVSTSARLTATPALLVGHEPEAMRRYRAMLTMMSDEATAAKLDELQNAAALELNPKHAVVKGIERLVRAAKDEKDGGDDGEKKDGGKRSRRETARRAGVRQRARLRGRAGRPARDGGPDPRDSGDRAREARGGRRGERRRGERDA